ncbi:hypothetical protein OHAE_5060 [Ochrobactrum soli]|uniref:Uncharacterized protein n=1 Tax=Ochrobactrum soli TaxID=2448455 RepID=A0A2P9HDV1_9HYPH|nr:hypothetical protein OHAE_5060 [[Ochrobactrum] soli]
MSRRFIGKTAAIVSSVSARRSMAETGDVVTGQNSLIGLKAGFQRRIGHDFR